MPVDVNLINTIAAMITDDPRVVNEFHVPGDRREFGAPGGTYVADEVPLTQDHTIMGKVEYQYDINQHGQHVPATYYEPASHPEIELTNLQVNVLEAYDEMGNPVQVSPEFANMAAGYFRKFLKSSAVEKAYEELS